MNSKILLSAMLLISAVTAHAGRESGGGVRCLQSLQTISDIVREVTPQLKSLNHFGVSSSEFLNKISKVKFDVEKDLHWNGKTVDALNFPDEIEPKIVVDIDRCDKLLVPFSEGMSFFVHEILGLMKKESREDYSISKKVLQELKKIVVVKPIRDWKYVCSVRRWHYSDRAGYEYLGLIDTYGSGGARIDYLYSRTDHALDEYALAFEVTSGSSFYDWLNSEPRLTYTFYRDLDHDSTKREYLIPAWTPIQFDKGENMLETSEPGKVNIQLLGPEAFSHEGEETSSKLELICYRSI